MVQVTPEAVRYATRNNVFFMKDLYRGLTQVDLSPIADRLNLEEVVYTLAMHAQLNERSQGKENPELAKIKHDHPNATERGVIGAYIRHAIAAKDSYAGSRLPDAGDKGQDNEFNQWNAHPAETLEMRASGRGDTVVPLQVYKRLEAQVRQPVPKYVLSESERTGKQDIVMDFLPSGITKENAAERGEELKDAYCLEISKRLEKYEFQSRIGRLGTDAGQKHSAAKKQNDFWKNPDNDWIRHHYNN